MRNYPYVVVLSRPTVSQSLRKALVDLEIPNFFDARDVLPGENRAERVRAELNAADVVLVAPGTAEVLSDRELEALLSRKSADPAFKVIPLFSSSETTPPDWLKGVEPLFDDPDNPSKTMASIVSSLIPAIETRPEETLDELLAEAKALVLRLQFIEDQYRHSLVLLGLSSLVFAAGFLTVTYAVRAGSGNPLSGFYQFFGLVVLVVGGFSLFFSILNWSSQYRRSRLARRVKEFGLDVIDETEKDQNETVSSSRSSKRNTNAESHSIL
jgi:hypothetical protein